MKTVSVETKNGGNIDVDFYETLTEATDAFQDAGVLKLFNRQFRTEAINKVNRERSLAAQLKKAVKDGKVTQAEVDEKLLAIIKNL